jgi:REP element-mobilizing transposase RayT
MSQSLAKNLIHLTFSTKDREPSLKSEAREGLHRYMAGILCDLDSPALIINSVADHAHLLFNLNKNQPLCDVVMEVKRGSSKWLKTQGLSFCQFHWQGGYGAFSIGQSGVSEVKSYIARQEEHHRVKTFQEEFRGFLKRYEIAFDEQYIWT